MRVHVLRTFVTHLLVHIHQKKEITLEIAAKSASVLKRVLTCWQILCKSTMKCFKITLFFKVFFSVATGATIISANIWSPDEKFGLNWRPCVSPLISTGISSSLLESNLMETVKPNLILNRWWRAYLMYRSSCVGPHFSINVMHWLLPIFCAASWGKHSRKCKDFASYLKVGRPHPPSPPPMFLRV